MTIRAITKLAVALYLGAATASTPLFAGELVLLNKSRHPISCQVDGWTVATGGESDWNISVQPGQPFYVIPNPAHGDDARIDWVTCGNLTTRMMGITPAGPQHPLVLNGKQERVLNVSLYPWIPTAPGDEFNKLVKHVITGFQATHQKVLVNAVTSQDFDIYDYAKISELAGPGGLDVLEIDVLYLGHLVSQNLIEPVTNATNILPVAREAVTIGTTEYAVPSLLCYDFLFSKDSSIHGIGTLSGLLSYLASSANGELAASFNGSWRTVAMYIHAYVETYGYSNIANALVMPPDSAVIDSLVELLNSCERSDGSNPCVDRTYYNLPNGSIERSLASGDAGTSIGFSEQSFFVNLFGQSNNTFLTPMVWGDTPQPLLYADGFVTNSSTCGSASSCSADAKDFINFMVGLPMRNYIVAASDLPQRAPWRTLLVARSDFWSQPKVVANPIYSQINTIFSSAKPLPNTMDETTKNSINTGVCDAIKTSIPGYAC